MYSDERLNASVVIQDRKAKYCRYLDTKQFDAWEGLFKADARIVFINPDGSVLGAFKSISELSPLARKVFGPRVTAHHIHNCEIEFNSETQATAIWSMSDCQIHPATAEEQPELFRGRRMFHCGTQA